jgi:hypothetical protein
VPSVQVARPPLTHDFCPDVQLFEHVRAHAAPGALPEHACGAVQLVVDETNAHESLSTEQVATVRPSWHTVPGPAQMEAAQVHEAALADIVHVWCAPHVWVVVQAVHPLDCTWQVWTAPDAH